MSSLDEESYHEKQPDMSTSPADEHPVKEVKPSASAAPPTSDKIHILIKIPSSGKEIELDVDLSESIENIKKMIHEIEGIPYEQQRLIFAGKYLEDFNTLAEYNFRDNTEVFLAIKRPIPDTFFEDYYNDPFFTDVHRFDNVKRTSDKLTDEYVLLMAHGGILSSHLGNEPGKTYNDKLQPVSSEVSKYLNIVEIAAAHELLWTPGILTHDYYKLLTGPEYKLFFQRGRIGDEVRAKFDRLIQTKIKNNNNVPIHTKLIEITHDRIFSGESSLAHMDLHKNAFTFKDLEMHYMGLFKPIINDTIMKSDAYSDVKMIPSFTLLPHTKLLGNVKDNHAKSITFGNLLQYAITHKKRLNIIINSCTIHVADSFDQYPADMKFLMNLDYTKNKMLLSNIYEYPKRVLVTTCDFISRNLDLLVKYDDFVYENSKTTKMGPKSVSQLYGEALDLWTNFNTNFKFIHNTTVYQFDYITQILLPMEYCCSRYNPSRGDNPHSHSGSHSGYGSGSDSGYCSGSGSDSGYCSGSGSGSDSDSGDGFSRRPFIEMCDCPRKQTIDIAHLHPSDFSNGANPDAIIMIFAARIFMVNEIQTYLSMNLESINLHIEYILEKFNEIENFLKEHGAYYLKNILIPYVRNVKKYYDDLIKYFDAYKEMIDKKSMIDPDSILAKAKTALMRNKRIFENIVAQSCLVNYKFKSKSRSRSDALDKYYYKSSKSLKQAASLKRRKNQLTHKLSNGKYAKIQKANSAPERSSVSRIEDDKRHSVFSKYKEGSRTRKRRDNVLKMQHYINKNISSKARSKLEKIQSKLQARGKLVKKSHSLRKRKTGHTI